MNWPSWADAAWLNAPAFHVFGKAVPWSDMFGNIGAIATIGLVLRRSLLSWPVQITASVLLIAASLSAHLGGNASRQVVIIVAAGYGWSKWLRGKRDSGDVPIRFATGRERLALITFMGAATTGYALFLGAVGWSWAPWPDAYIFVGSAAAMYAQAKGWVEFWFVWIAVDMVGIPLQINSGLVFSALVYGVMFAMVVVGLRDWWRRSRERGALGGAAEQAEAPGHISAPAAVAARGPRSLLDRLPEQLKDLEEADPEPSGSELPVSERPVTERPVTELLAEPLNDPEEVAA